MAVAGKNAVREARGAAVPAPATVEAVLELLVLLQTEVESHGSRRHEDGIARVNHLCTEVTRDVLDGLAAGSFVDPEFAAVLDVQLMVRYLRAVRDDALGATVARSWRVLFERRAVASIAPVRFALAGVNAQVNHDLAVALVSTSTVLDRPPGAVERQDFTTLTHVLAERLRRHAGEQPGGGPGGAVDDDVVGLVAELSRGASWRRAEHLWTLRGRPGEAEAERASIDWRASMIGRAILTRGSTEDAVCGSGICLP
ncbi:DUF5995 family protein [Pseudonocardia bannensis]|uniref:Uncharacterized protein n=1 Tax=Pseudonocardia bannensis TaxID=630973 RepID=A0A848DKL8_9PSEU|nr:DUF5995 family protein [Pseudonocardia bannensis]NMH93093.1 hypothetical protein [Pseudonocardia bannensis]